LGTGDMYKGLPDYPVQDSGYLIREESIAGRDSLGSEKAKDASH